MMTAACTIAKMIIFLMRSGLSRLSWPGLPRPSSPASGLDSSCLFPSSGPAFPEACLFSSVPAGFLRLCRTAYDLVSSLRPDYFLNLMERSMARTFLVSAPTEMKSTPVFAYSPMVLRSTFPEISSFTRWLFISTALYMSGSL